MAEGGAKIDLPAHERTYAHFIGLFKWGAIICFLIGLLVMYLITRCHAGAHRGREGEHGRRAARFRDARDGQEIRRAGRVNRGRKRRLLRRLDGRCRL